MKVISAKRAEYHSIFFDGVSVDSAYLFGSYAKRRSSKFSDIDVAVISSDFSDDRFEEGIKLSVIAGKSITALNRFHLRQAVLLKMIPWFGK